MYSRKILEGFGVTYSRNNSTTDVQAAREITRGLSLRYGNIQN
jgi:hypothetical protein